MEEIDYRNFPNPADIRNNVNFQGGNASPEMRAVEQANRASQAANRAGAAVQEATTIARNAPVPEAAAATEGSSMLGRAARFAGKAVAPVAIGMTAVDVANTPTEDYQRRFGIEPGRNELSPGWELARDLGTRTLGAASDFVNVGGVFDRFYADKNGSAKAAVGTNGAPQNAQPDFSLMTPRVTAANINQQPRAKVIADMPTTVNGAPGITKFGRNSYSGTGDTPQAPAMTTEQANEYYGAQLAAMRANEAQGQDRAFQASMAGNRAAQASYDRGIAEQAARVSAFRAKNGADMVLAPGRASADQRKAIIGDAMADNARAGQARNDYSVAQAAFDGAGRTNYIDDFARQQSAVQAGQQAALQRPSMFAQNEASQLDLQGKKMDLQTKGMNAKFREQLAAIDAQIANTTDKAQLSMLHNKRLALIGKAPDNKVAIIDVDTGEKDMAGNTVFKKAAINLATGDLLGGEQQQANDPVSALKALPRDQAVQQAKNAIARGAKLDDVNARLKAAGHPTL